MKFIWAYVYQIEKKSAIGKIDQRPHNIVRFIQAPVFYSKLNTEKKLLMCK